jgi:magnesium-transporting ATPase (P-type)
MVCALVLFVARCSFDIRTSADAPIKDIHTFIGTFTIHTPRAHSVDDVPMVQVPTVEPLSAENVLWSNTVLAAGSAVGFIVYTGSETRAVMNTSHPETKVGLLDLEINRLAKVRHIGTCVKENIHDSLHTDSLRGDVRAIVWTRCIERVQGTVVYLCIPFPHIVFVYHPHQVCLPPTENERM